jgi:hypothetical protein
VSERWWRDLAGPVVLVVALGVSLIWSRDATGRTEPGPSTIDKVVVVGVPELGIDDLEADVMPTLDRLATRGAIAMTYVRTAAEAPDVAGAFATLGSGVRTRGTDLDVSAFPADAPFGGGTVAQAMEAERGAPVRGRIVLPSVGALAEDLLPDQPDHLGGLGDALRAAGHRTAVVANAGSGTEVAAAGQAAPAALAVVGGDGGIDAGSVDASLVTPDPDGPGGPEVARSRPAAYAAAVRRALRTADVVVVDPGDTTRDAARRRSQESAPEPQATTTTTQPADRPAPEVDPVAEAEAARLAALGRADRVLAAIDRGLGRRTLLIVVGVTPAQGSWALTPMVIGGGGAPGGYLDSGSTHRPALVTLTDVAPTVLDALGVDVPSQMIGSPLRYRPGDHSWDDARRLDDLLERRKAGVDLMAATFGTVQAVLYGVALILLVRGAVPRRLGPALCFGALTCAAWPLATFLLRLAPSWYGFGAGTLALSWLIALAVAAVAARFRAHPLDPALVVCGATVATLVADLVTGAHLQVASFFGYTPNTAPRFIGIGNGAFAVLAASTVVVMVAIVARAGPDRREQAWRLAAWLALTVVIVDGAPWIGADVGGILTMVPVLSITLWALRGGRVQARTVAIGLGITALVLGVAVGVEALRDPSSRTHIGRFFLNSGQDGVAGGTFRRKWDANTRFLRRAPYLWAVPFLTVGAAWLAARSERVARYLPRGSAERVGAVSILAIGMVGWVVNDSGLVVLGLAALYLGPFVLLLERAAGAPPDVATDPRTQTRTPVP